MTVEANIDNKERMGINMRFKIHALDPITYKIIEHKGYVLTREKSDGSLYDFTVRMGQVGHSQAWVDRWAKQVSKRLHAGEPLLQMCKEELHQHFEPSGGTDVPGIPRCDSPIDLICKWLLMRYQPTEWAEMNNSVKP